MKEVNQLVQDIIQTFKEPIEQGLTEPACKPLMRHFWSLDYNTFHAVAPILIQEVEAFGVFRSTIYIYVSIAREYLLKGDLFFCMYYVELTEQQMELCTDRTLNLEIFPDIYHTYSTLFCVRKEYKKGLAQIEKALNTINYYAPKGKERPLSTLARCYISIIKIQTKLQALTDAEASLVTLKKELDEHPNCPAYYYYFLHFEKARVYVHQEKFEQAAVAFEEAESILKTLSFGKALAPYFNQVKALYYHKTKDYPNAIKCYLAAIESFKNTKIHVDLLDTYESLTDLYLELEDYQNALAYQQEHHELYLQGLTKENNQLLKLLDYKNKAQQLEFEFQQRKQFFAKKEHFFFNITHDLRNTLSLIINPIQTALTELEQAPDRTPTTYIQTAINNSDTFLNLSQRLLEVSQMEGDKNNAAAPVILSETIDWVALAKEAWEKFQQKAQAKGLHYQFSSNVAQLVGKTDIEKCKRILYNLLSNAIKFTPEGEKVELKLEFEPQTTRLLIEVNDTGMGIPKADQAYIFERFYQLEHLDSKGGVGLGLSIVKQLSELLSIDLEWTSEPNLGSTFALLIAPQLQNSEVPKLSAIQLIASTTPTHLGSSPTAKILLVEDNLEVAQYIQQLLQSQQFQVLHCVDPTKALSLIPVEQPQLIISDGKLPNMSGFEFCKAIKSELSSSHIPLILLTALSDEAHFLKGIESGADVYLTKPFDQQTLLLQIKRLLEGRKLLRQHYQQQLQTTTVATSATPNSTSSNPLDEIFLEQLLQKIEANLDRKELSTENLSKDLRVHRRTLYRKVKNLLNLSVNELIRKKRLMRAHQLLQAQENSVGEVATAVGFSCDSYFARAFKKEFGVLPSKLLS